MKLATLKGIPKKRGRPATGRDPVVCIRLPQELIDRADAQAAKGKTTRSQIVRKWIEKGAG